MAKMPAWITRDERPTCGEADAPIWRGRKAGRLKVLPIGLGADVLSPLTVHEGRRWFGCIVYILYSIGYVEYTLHHWFGRGGLEMRVHIVTSSWLIRCRDRAKGVYIYIQSTTTDHGSSLYTHQKETVYWEGHYNVSRRQSMAYANHPMSPVASSKGNGHTRAYRRAELYTLRPQLAQKSLHRSHRRGSAQVIGFGWSESRQNYIMAVMEEAASTGIVLALKWSELTISIHQT